MGNEVAIQNGNSMLAPANMEQAMKLAEMMSNAKLVPAHLQGKAADCLLVIEQASRWKMSPFAVAQCTSVISGKLMYEGKLVAAVVNANGGLEERLSFAYKGTGENRAITVSGKFKGEKEPRTVEVIFKDVKTANSMWQKQSDQQLMYSGARAWARRHAPELMLGVYSPEEFDQASMVEVTPATGEVTAKQAFGSAKAMKERWSKLRDEMLACRTHVELERVFIDAKADFATFKSIDEQLYDNLVQVGVQRRAAITEAEQPTENDSTFDPEEEMPPFVRQQMQEERERMASKGLAH